MTSHELAKILLSLPDLPVATHANNHTYASYGDNSMKLSALEKFEIQAEAFHILTGQLHPGKDSSPQSGVPYEERKHAWDAWIKEHAPVVIAMMAAFEYTLPDVPNGTELTGAL